MKEGATVPVTLVIEGKDKKRSTVELKAPVKPLTTSRQGGAGTQALIDLQASVLSAFLRP
jgi:hypothetical protein